MSSYSTRCQPYILAHLGALNVLADMVSRWVNENYKKPKDKLIQLIVSVKSKEVDPVTDDTHPTNLKDYIDQMGKYRIFFLNPYYKRKQKHTTENEVLNLYKKVKPSLDTLEKDKGKLVIPLELVLRLVVYKQIASVYPSKTVELEKLNTHFIFKLPFNIKLENLANELHRQCAHCIRIPALIRTPYYKTELGRSRGSLLRLDFLHVSNEGYFLFILDDSTRKISLTYCE
eukprot:snap_masked-scaffold_4-processed-gene-7.39-mRNA-1 protein AED:1.00 eAED:1.00 QI:0/0/0/0/1/1/2/0/229